MKKIILPIVALALFATTSCSSDDDNNGGGQNDCQTCELDVLGTVIESEYCDNGDGTMTVTTEGQEQTVSLEGQDFDDVIAGLELAGATCN